MKKLLILSLFISFTLYVVSAQEVPVVPPSDTLSAKEVQVNTPANSVKISKNFIKFNITSALIKNYSLQYERVLSRSVSATVSFRIMPESGIPYTDNIFKWFDITDPEAQNVIENAIIGNFAITPEIRFYTGKKRYGNGFYFALFTGMVITKLVTLLSHTSNIPGMISN